MIAALEGLGLNPQFWIVLGITLAFCGVLVLFSWLGTLTAKRLDSVSTESRVGRLTRHWGFWFAPAMAVFAVIIVLAMANAVVPAFLLIIPYAYFAAVGIYREGR